MGDRVNSLKIEKSLENIANLKTTIILFRPVTHQQLCDRRHTFKKQKEKKSKKKLSLYQIYNSSLTKWMPCIVSFEVNKTSCKGKNTQKMKITFSNTVNKFILWRIESVFNFYLPPVKLHFILILFFWTTRQWFLLNKYI